MNTWLELRQQPASQVGWYAVGLASLLVALYFSLAKIGIGGLVHSR
jgi:hypothetical protein